MAHYTENLHPEYILKSNRWQEALDHYTGDYATDKIDQYLFRKEQRETDQAFAERKKVADPQLHFSTAIDGLCGVMFSKAKDTKREWGGLGDPDDPGSVAYRLTNDADQEGTNWTSVFKQAAIKLAVTHNIWGLVDGIKMRTTETGEQVEDGDATIHIIDPTAVINWYPSTGKLQQVLVRERHDTRRSIFDSFPDQDTYILFTLDGWRRFRVATRRGENGQEELVEETLGEGEYEFYRTSDKKDRILPIFRVQIPMPRDVGFLLARKENAIFNMKSVRDFAVRILSFALLRLTANDMEEYNQIVETLMKGASVVGQFGDTSHPHDFISPDSSWLSEAASILKKDIEDFYQNAFKEYGDAAAQRTATEIRLESQTGIEAFLSLLVGAVDEFENQCLWRLEQVYDLPPSQWGQAFVERSTNFTPRDEQEAIDKLVERYFGKSRVPATVEHLVSVAERIMTMDNLGDLKEADRDALKGVVESYIAAQDSERVGNLRRFDLVSIEQGLSILYPEKEEDWIKQEAERIQAQRGALSIPDPFMGD